MHAQLDDLLTALTCWSTTSSPSAEAPAGRRGSRTPSSSRWRSPKSSWTAERPPVSGAHRLPALAPVRLPATSVGLQQASARAHPTDRASDQLPRLLLAGVVRSVAAARFDPDPLRGLARDGSALRVRGDRS